MGIKGNLVRLETTNAVHAQPKQFNQNTYDASKENAEQVVNPHVIRWRIKTDAQGNAIRDKNNEAVLESNASIVKWSDGTFQLVVGDEVFDMAELCKQGGTVWT